MGCKRPFEEMEFEELRFKHPRQLEFSNKPASFSELVSCYNTPQDLFIIGKDEAGSCKFQRSEMHEKDTGVKFPPSAEIDFVTGNSLSLVTYSTGEEDTSFDPFEGVACAHHSPGHSEFGFPRRPFVPVEDAYSSSLNCSPRRHVPIGPNHQASIPIWTGNAGEKRVDHVEMLESKGVQNCNEEKVMGTCVIPMANSNLPAKESGEVGIGRAECCCLDAGSVRCVRQHVRERRESLRRSLGEKKFVNLGFYEMGEEVSRVWSEEEELDFREVVYSNPVSLGRNFWNRLSAVFPSRSKKEIVSYYFNVFMLRKRASQNRSRSLDIDSDDDEWHGISGGNSPVIQESDDEEDSAIESLGDQPHNKEGLTGDRSRESYNSDDREFAARDHGVIDQDSRSSVPNSVNECQFYPVDGISDRFQDDCVFQDDSCMSFECQANMSDSCGPVDDKAAFKLSGVRTENVKCPDGKPGLVDHLYLSDSLDSKVWDARFNVTCPEISFDLLPWDMIEEDILETAKTTVKPRTTKTL